MVAPISVDCCENNKSCLHNRYSTDFNIIIYDIQFNLFSNVIIKIPSTLGNFIAYGLGQVYLPLSYPTRTGGFGEIASFSRLLYVSRMTQINQVIICFYVPLKKLKRKRLQRTIYI